MPKKSPIIYGVPWGVFHFSADFSHILCGKNFFWQPGGLSYTSQKCFIIRNKNKKKKEKVCLLKIS